jgi:hypothetical protein
MREIEDSHSIAVPGKVARSDGLGGCTADPLSEIRVMR